MLLNPTKSYIKICEWHKIALIHTNSRNFSNSPTRKASKRRVVVTGLGVVSPVGCDTKTAWNNILSGSCGIKKLSDSAYETLPCKVAAKISDEELKLDKHFSKSDLRALAPATAYALIAGKLNIMHNLLTRFTASI